MVARSTHVVPGHGPVLDGAQALAVLEDDLAYLLALRKHGVEAELPAHRRTRYSRRVHARNAAELGADASAMREA